MFLYIILIQFECWSTVQITTMEKDHAIGRIWPIFCWQTGLNYGCPDSSETWISLKEEWFPKPKNCTTTSHSIEWRHLPSLCILKYNIDNDMSYYTMDYAYMYTSPRIAGFRVLRRNNRSSSGTLRHNYQWSRLFQWSSIVSTPQRCLIDKGGT